MKFSVGYQLFEGFEFIEKIIEHKDKISEVYFSFGDFPNGRNNQLKRGDMTPEAAKEKQIFDLSLLARENITFNVLFNATCYGKDSQSREFFSRIGDTLDFISESFKLGSVTTASPLIAKFVKSNFEGVDVRASVNMGIGSPLGMEYLAEYFDSFYLKRELNRDFDAIRDIKKWCDENGKALYALANSGCLNFCSAHTFHDNLVSHESDIAKMDNGFEFSGVCREFLSKKENLKRIFDCTNFIRPEDIHLYEGLFPSMKLATRVNANPIRVLDSYLKHERHLGSVFDLCEPNHSGLLRPYILDNAYIESEVLNGKLIYSNIKNALIRLEDLC